MAWYRTGTIAVANGSATVTGTGTAFVGNVIAGFGINAPDGRTYEVAAVVSSTQLTLATPYMGANASGQAYSILPTRGPEVRLAEQLAVMVNDYGAAFTGAGAGKFGDGTLAQPGMRFAADENTGVRRKAADVMALLSAVSCALRSVLPVPP